MIPQIPEKELLLAVGHANSFIVSARRVHQLLAPTESYESWMQVALLKHTLEPGTDY